MGCEVRVVDGAVAKANGGSGWAVRFELWPARWLKLMAGVGGL